MGNGDNAMARQSTLTEIRKSIGTPDEVREFDNGKVELVTLGDATVGRFTLRPGFKWSNDIKPLVNTDLCRESHFQYVISGRLIVEMEDGTRLELKAGDVVAIPPGHDAWVVGDLDYVAIDLTGVRNYAKR
jgi:mannose-6-phosphate isomerase-like protein (cupin superfamily)